jgi:hypothetical protein
LLSLVEARLLSGVEACPVLIPSCGKKKRKPGVLIKFIF